MAAAELPPQRFAALGEPPRFSTIYDALGAWRNDFMIGSKPHEGLFKGNHPLDTSEAKLYDAIARFLAEFAIADLRHDFTTELNIIIDAMSKKSIGLFQIRQICGAYYALNSPRFDALYKAVCTAYIERMTSDTTAKAYTEKQTVKFFSEIFPELRKEHFEESAYVKLLEQSHSFTGMRYDTNELLNYILGKVKPAERPILIDAQMGNPNEELFSYSNKQGTRATYLFNFASVLDAAEKLTANVHTYMNVYKQAATPPEITIEPYIGAYMHKNIISAPKYNREIKDWEVQSKFIFGGGGAGTKEYARTFSSTDKASVNELGLIRTRGRGTDAEARAAEQEALMINAINPMHVSADHQFKSTGDRYQVYSVSQSFPYKKTAGFYKYHGNLRTEAPSAAGTDLPAALMVSPIVITNDILNKYQCYFFQVNTLFTESRALTFLDYKQGEIITDENVRKSITPDIVAKIYDIIQKVTIPKITIGTPYELLASIYNSAAAKRLRVQCKNVPFLVKFLGPVAPSPLELQQMVNKKNASLFYSYLMGDIEQNLRGSVNWTEQQNKGFVRQISTYIEENRELVNSLTNLIQYANLYAVIMLHVETIESYLSDMLIENHADILAHLIFLKIGGSAVAKPYSKGNIQTLLDSRRGTILSRALNNACALYKYNRETAESKLKPIIEIIERYAPTTTSAAAPSYLSELKATLRTCQLKAIEDVDFASVYSMLDPIILFTLIFKLIGSVSKSSSEQDRLLREILAANGFEIEERPVVVGRLVSKFTRKATRPAVAKAKVPVTMRTQRLQETRAARETARGRTLAQKRKLPAPPVATDVFDPLGKLVEREDEPMTGDVKPIGLTAAEAESYMIRPEDMPKAEDLRSMTVFTPLKSFVSHLPAAISRTAQEIYAAIRSVFSAFRGGATSFGGTRSRSPSPTSLYELCKKKLELMCMMIGKPHMEFAGMYLFASFAQLNLIRQNMLAARRSSRSVTLSVPVMRGGGGSQEANASTITAETVEQISDASLEASSPLSVSMRKPKAQELIHKQLLSFFFAGFSRDHDAIATEKRILGQHLPVIVRDEISSTHNQLFWHPLFNRVTADYDEFANLYTKMLQEIGAPTKKRSYRYSKTISVDCVRSARGTEQSARGTKPKAPTAQTTRKTKITPYTV